MSERTPITPDEVVAEELPRLVGIVWEPWEGAFRDYPDELLTQFYAHEHLPLDDGQRFPNRGLNGESKLYVEGANWSITLAMVLLKEQPELMESEGSTFLKPPDGCYAFEIVRDLETDDDPEGVVGQVIWIQLFRPEHFDEGGS